MVRSINFDKSRKFLKRKEEKRKKGHVACGLTRPPKDSFWIFYFAMELLMNPWGSFVKYTLENDTGQPFLFAAIHIINVAIGVFFDCFNVQVKPYLESKPPFYHYSVYFLVLNFGSTIMSLCLLQHPAWLFKDIIFSINLLVW